MAVVAVGTVMPQGSRAVRLGRVRCDVRRIAMGFEVEMDGRADDLRDEPEREREA